MKSLVNVRMIRIMFPCSYDFITLSNTFMLNSTKQVAMTHMRITGALILVSRVHNIIGGRVSYFSIACLL